MIREDEFHRASNAPVRIRPRSAPVHHGIVLRGLHPADHRGRTGRRETLSHGIPLLHHPRPHTPSRRPGSSHPGAQGNRENGSPCRRTAAGRAGRRRSGDRSDDRHGRRAGLRGNPVQPGSGRETPAGERVQAFRPPHGAFGRRRRARETRRSPRSYPASRCRSLPRKGCGLRRISKEKRTERSRFGRQSRIP